MKVRLALTVELKSPFADEQAAFLDQLRFMFLRASRYIDEERKRIPPEKYSTQEEKAAKDVACSELVREFQKVSASMNFRREEE